MNAGRTALEGIRVLDVTQVMAGPFCAMQLCDMGADVIKVEPPGGDSTRRMAGASGDDSAGFNAVNRGKRGIVLDLGTARGQDAMRRLLGSADILIENYRPGVMRRFGLDYATLAEQYPALIYASISGYGQTGPAAAKGGFDLIAQGVSGLMSVTGEPGRPPVKVGVPLTDLGAGAVRTGGDPGGAPLPHPNRPRPAHRHVARRGRDRPVGVGIGRVLRARASRRSRSGSAHRMLAPYQAIRCADGYITMAAGTDRLFRAPLRGARAPGVDRRPCFRERHAAGSQPRGAHRADRGDDHRGTSRSLGWRASKRRGSPADRSTTTPRPSPIRRSWPAGWSSTSITRRSAACARWDRRSRCRRRRRWPTAARRSWENTRGRRCARRAAPRARSGRSWSKAASRCSSLLRSPWHAGSVTPNWPQAEIQHDAVGDLESRFACLVSRFCRGHHYRAHRRTDAVETPAIAHYRGVDAERIPDRNQDVGDGWLAESRQPLIDVPAQHWRSLVWRKRRLRPATGEDNEGQRDGHGRAAAVRAHRCFPSSRNSSPCLNVRAGRFELHNGSIRTPQDVGGGYTDEV